MQEIEYKFADGTVSTVEVSDELYAIIEEMEKEEKSRNRSETRRHVSLEELAQLSIEPPVTDVYDYGDMFRDVQDERLYTALQKLNTGQRDFIYKVFFERIPLKDIAEEENVSRAAISLRLKAILEQLRLSL